LRTSGSEPGRRSVSVRAVSSKSSPEDAAEEDSAVELRAGPSDMLLGGRGRVRRLLFPSVTRRRDGAGGRRKWL
jgi:hypothetical protein